MLTAMSSGTSSTPAVQDTESVETKPGLLPPTQRRRSQMLIGDVIVELGFAPREKVEEAVLMAREQGRTTGQILIDSGVIQREQLTRALAERFGVDYVDLGAFEIDPEAMALIDAELAKRYQAVPVGFLTDGSVVLAMTDPTNVLTLDEISMITGRKLRPAAAAHEEIASLIARYNRLDLSHSNLEEEHPDELEVNLGDGPADAPVVKLVQQIVAHAVELGASDIHLTPGRGETKVHYRVDGVLTEAAAVTRSMTPGVVSRIKIMAGIDISERRLPQDGTMSVKLEGRAVDVRVVTLPLAAGEGAVLRILDSEVVVRDLVSLGMDEQDRKRFESAIAKPYGAVLVTGPTGSGKSTTLYAALSLMNDGKRSILTIEDPVESPIAGIKQMQVATKAGLTFAGGLRSILRADPDVIMVGEIRDRETAEIAAQAAFTGHLMLSTLHTRDAASAMTRLVDMGVEPFIVAAAIDCVIAQRLARTLCSFCKRPVTLAREVLDQQGLDGVELFEPAGCIRCAGTGFRGRVGLFEVMPVTDEIRGALLEQRGARGIAAVAAEQGMRTMRDDGLVKVRQGLTSLAEVARTTSTV